MHRHRQQYVEIVADAVGKQLAGIHLAHAAGVDGSVVVFGAPNQRGIGAVGHIVEPRRGDADGMVAAETVMQRIESVEMEARARQRGHAADAEQRLALDERLPADAAEARKERVESAADDRARHCADFIAAIHEIMRKFGL